MRQRWRDCCSLSLVTDNLIQIILALTYKGLGLEGDPVAVVPGGLSSGLRLECKVGVIRDKLILAINAGSSSVKFSAYRIGPALISDLEGYIDTHDGRPARFVARIGGKQRFSHIIGEIGIEMAVEFLARWLGENIDGKNIHAVSHRIVFPHAGYPFPAAIDAALLTELHAATSSAANHLPLQIALIELLQRRYPGAAHVACFDCSFHSTMPAEATVLPIPRRLQALGYRRYGFHGISCDYIVRTLAESAGAGAASGKLIVAHLGSDASVTAIHRGQSRDTTMGFSTAGGMMMASRSGDLDPGLAWEFARRERIDIDTFHRMVNHESGLLGVSGISADMRDLLARESSDQHAAQAVALFCYHARKAICAMAGAIDGLDTLVFTGGIGERAATIRERICSGLGHLGVCLDSARNTTNAKLISNQISNVDVSVPYLAERRKSCVEFVDSTLHEHR